MSTSGYAAASSSRRACETSATASSAAARPPASSPPRSASPIRPPPTISSARSSGSRRIRPQTTHAAGASGTRPIAAHDRMVGRRSRPGAWRAYLRQMRTSIPLIAIAALLLIVGYLLGSRSSDGMVDIASEPAPNAAPPAAERAERPRRGDTERFRRGAAGDEPGGVLGADRERARRCRHDTERQSELLEERVSRLPPRQIVRFQETRRQMDARAYTWDIWGAAYVSRTAARTTASATSAPT